MRESLGSTKPTGGMKVKEAKGTAMCLTEVGSRV